MTATTRPTNQICFPVEIDFSDCGLKLCNIDDILISIGYSRAEVKRLRRSGAIKLLDSKYDNGVVWYRRAVKDSECLEHDDIIYLGKGYKHIHILSKPVGLGRRIKLWLRSLWEKFE